MVFETVDIKIINTKNMNSLIDGDQGSLEKRALVSLLKPGHIWKITWAYWHVGTETKMWQLKQF